MAVVYLPYGYPLQSGAAYDAIVYQGSMVRVYTLPTDPRTTEQLFNRRFLADTSKMRKMLGVWGKAAGRTVFGTTWGSIVYQLIKADEGGVWSDAESAWSGFYESERDAWRAVAPYLATYNDPGKMFYCYARALGQLMISYSAVAWGAMVWGASDSAAAAAWWAKDYSSALGIGSFEENNSLIVYHGTWGRDDGAPNYGLHGGYYEIGSSGASHWAECFFHGRFLWFGYALASGYAGVKISLDGGAETVVNQYSTIWTPQQVQVFDSGWKGLHYLKVADASGQKNLDWLEVH